MPRELLFSVQGTELKMQTFTVSGAGGQGRDHVNTGVRFVHPESGATGECREHREQGRNKRAALVKMTKHPKFTFWVHEKVKVIDGKKTAEQIVEEMMARVEDIKVEYQVDGKWVEVV